MYSYLTVVSKAYVIIIENVKKINKSLKRINKFHVPLGMYSIMSNMLIFEIYNIFSNCVNFYERLNFQSLIFTEIKISKF